MRQNGTIKRKQPCLLERGSRNYLLHLLLSFVPFLLSFLRERYSLLPSTYPFYSSGSLSLFLSCSLAFPLLSSVDTIESVYRRCYEYKNFVQEKKTGSMGFLPILIRLPLLGTSVHRFSAPSSHKQPLVFFSIIGRCSDHL